MSYTNDIPAAGDSLGGTRDRIRTNFELIQSVFGQNHWTFGQTSQGNHKFIQMPEVTASGALVPGTNPNEAAIYVDVGTSPSESNLFIRGENNGFRYQLTKLAQASSSLFGANANYGSPPATFVQTGGWTFLPGNLFFQYGFYGKNGSTGNGTVQFPVPFNNVFNITLGVKKSAGGASTTFINVVSNSNFTFVSSSSTIDGFYWQAIGN